MTIPGLKFAANGLFYRTRKNQNFSANLRIQVGPIKAGEPKTEDSVRVVSLPASALAALHTQCRRQEQFRQKYGQDYRRDLDLIFAKPDGTPLKPDSVSSSVSLLCRRLKAGIFIMEVLST